MNPNPYPLPETTPAERITGISDRCAAALEDVEQIRHAHPGMGPRLDRITAALRERRRPTRTLGRKLCGWFAVLSFIAMAIFLALFWAFDLEWARWVGAVWAMPAMRFLGQWETFRAWGRDR